MATFCALLAAAGYAIFLGAWYACPVADHHIGTDVYLFHASSFEEQNDRLRCTFSSDRRYICDRSLPAHMACEQHPTPLPPGDGGRVRLSYGQRRRDCVRLDLH